MELDNFETEINSLEQKFNEDDRSEKNAAAILLQAETDGDKEHKTKRPSHELGLFEGISNQDYQTSAGISSTTVKYADKAMVLYHQVMQGNVPFKESEAMRLGTAVHKLTLEALDFSKEIAVSKKFGRKKADQEEKAEFYAEHQGMTIIDSDQYEKCRRMRDSLMSLPDVAIIFESGKPERSGYYIDKGRDGTGMLCKYRPDWRTDWCLFDIKSTTDISSGKFSRTVNDFGYHISAAHYLDGDKITTGTDHGQFIFGCVESEPPFLAITYTLGAKSLEFGRWARRNALNGIKHGRDTGEWPLYNHGITTDIEVPSYAMYDFEKAKI